MWQIARERIAIYHQLTRAERAGHQLFVVADNPFFASPYDLLSHSYCHVCKGTRMQKPDHLFHLFMLIAAIAFCSVVARAQTSADVHNGIKVQPSTIRWCLPQAGDDPAHIIGGRYKVYRDCLSDLSLDESIDRIQCVRLPLNKLVTFGSVIRPSSLPPERTRKSKAQLRRSSGCSTLYIRGTEAKSFPVPSNLGDPR